MAGLRLAATEGFVKPYLTLGARLFQNTGSMGTEMDHHAPDTPSASAVRRTMAILECLDSSRRGLNISEVSRKLEIPKSSAHVLMVTLERLGYIRRAANSRDFRLGLKTYALGQRMAKMLSISDLALPHMQLLASETGLSAHLAVLDHDQAVFIQKAGAGSLVQLDTYVGGRADLHSTALGKIILAFGPSESTKHILSKQVFARYTPKTFRRLGHAIDDEEEELGIRCVAVPLLRRGCLFVAALSLSGTVAQMPFRGMDTMLARIAQCAAAITAENMPIPPLW
jgi:DNA-binding IclR family transcriptional regulator